MVTVAVLGASPKEERYSNKAVKLLLEHGCDVIPVHPLGVGIHGEPTVTSLDEIDRPVDTLSVYLGEKNAAPLQEKILALRPRRIILNPGAENGPLERAAEETGIEVQQACTLVLLRTGQF